MENNSGKNIFNKRLYLDALKQLKIIGVMSAVITALASFLIPMGYNISNSQYNVEYINNIPHYTGRVISYGILSLNPIIAVIFLLIPFFMTLYLFNFLNRRNASDFFHSLPDKRQCIFLSYFAAIFTWVMGLVLGGAIISTVAAGIFKYVELEAAGYGTVLLCAAASIVYIFGVMMIAASVTGTIFSNLCVSAMIAITPRLVVTYVIYIITSLVQVVPFTFGASIFDDRLNVVTNFVTGPVIRGSWDGVNSLSSGIYTLIVGLIYCGFAMYLFAKRKSEAAGQAAVSSKLQCVFRLIPACAITLLPVASLFIDSIEVDYMASNQLFFYVVMYIMAVVAYFGYELLTVKKLKSLIKAIPGLIFIVGFNIVMYVVLFASYTVMLNDIPESKDVDTVSVYTSDGHSRHSYYSNTNNYYKNELKNLKIDSDVIEELLCAELKENVDIIKNNEFPWNTKSYSLQVTFYCGWRSVTRMVYLSEDSYKKLTEEMTKNADINRLLYEPIQLDKISSISTYSSIDLPMEEAYELYNTYIEELKTMDTTSAYDYIVQGYSYNTVDSFEVFLKNEKKFNFNIRVDMPKTLSMYIEYTNKNSEFDNMMEEFLKNYGNKDIKEYVYGHMFMELYCPGEEVVSASAYYDISNGEVYADFTENGKDYLYKMSDKIESKDNIDITKPYISISLDYSSYSEDEGNKYMDGEKYYQVDDEFIEMFYQYTGYVR